MPLVLISFVLRLVPAAAVEGRIVGEVESVDSGRTQTIRSVDELVALVQDEQRRADGQARTSGGTS